jgi:hypothetical protein
MVLYGVIEEVLAGSYYRTAHAASAVGSSAVDTSPNDVPVPITEAGARAAFTSVATDKDYYGSNDEYILPNEFDLFQNYPNPFNPTTTISFRLPEAANVELRVYNISGQLVTTLLNEKVMAGAHEVVWDASDNASGVYYYRLVTDLFSESRKMVLLK